MKKFSKEYVDYLNSPKWNFMRHRVAELANYKCQLCNKKIKKGYHIHHLTYENFGNEKIQDLMFLCPECHLIKIHNQGNKIKKEKTKKEKLKKLTLKEKELFVNKEYFLNNFDKLPTEHKAAVTSYLYKNYKSLLKEYNNIRIKEKSYI